MSQDYIASDDANPNFVGQRDPDRSLSVLFYSKPFRNNFESEKQGRPIFSDMDMVKIITPGDDKNIIDTFAREDHKERFPLQWQHYVNKHEGDQQLVGKTPLSVWQRLTPAQAEELRHMKFISVDDIANASDSALQRIGMVGGMAPHAFREAAQRFLKMAAGESEAAAQAERTRAAEAENLELKQRMADMEARFSAMATTTAASPLDAVAAANSAGESEAAPVARRAKSA